MVKQIRTIVAYLMGIALQITCFLLGKNDVEDYNKDVAQYNASIPELAWWQRFIGEKPLPRKQDFDSSSGWFTVDEWADFEIMYYGVAELRGFIVLFTFTALAYLYLSGERIRKNHTILRVFSLVLSLLSAYVILYEIIAICR